MLGIYYLRHHGMVLTYLTRSNKGSEVQNKPNYRHKKAKKIKNKKIASGYNTDSANLARIRVIIEKNIMETIRIGLPPNGMVSNCLGNWNKI